MKNMIKVFVGLFLMVAIGSMRLHAAKPEVKGISAAIERVDKEMSLLDQIVEQAGIVVESRDEKAREHAKRVLAQLMKKKELNAAIRDAIKDDVKVIINPKTKRELYAARHRLMLIAYEINAKADVVAATAEAKEMVENASPEDLEKTIAQAKKKIEAAEAAEQGMMSRLYAGAKRMVTAPVDYVFGEESSTAKTAFYAAVGAAVLAAGAYITYQYGVGPQVEAPKVSPKDQWVALEKQKIELNIAQRPFEKKWRAAENGEGEPLTKAEDDQWEALAEQGEGINNQQGELEEKLYKKDGINSRGIIALREQARDEYRAEQNALAAVFDAKKSKQEVSSTDTDKVPLLEVEQASSLKEQEKDLLDDVSKSIEEEFDKQAALNRYEESLKNLKTLEDEHKKSMANDPRLQYIQQSQGLDRADRDALKEKLLGEEAREQYKNEREDLYARLLQAEEDNRKVEEETKKTVPFGPFGNLRMKYLGNSGFPY